MRYQVRVLFDSYGVGEYKEDKKLRRSEIMDPSFARYLMFHYEFEARYDRYENNRVITFVQKVDNRTLMEYVFYKQSKKEW